MATLIQSAYYCLSCEKGFEADELRAHTYCHSVKNEPLSCDVPAVADVRARPYQRLEGVLPEWTRVIWHGSARDVWEPRIRRIVDAWARVERESVVEGLRHAARLTVSAGELPALGWWAVERGLTIVPLERTGMASTYAAGPVALRTGEVGGFTVVLAQPGYAADFARAWRGGDDKAIGALLGYPWCCRAFFAQFWVDDRHVDTTWPMAIGSGAPDAAGVIRVGADAPLEANILWRWLGVRAVPHLPCSFACAETATNGRLFLELMSRLDREAAAWTREILSWPVEWSALHGIAEIRTPICKISTRTDLTADLVRVRREGTAYPAEGARGLSFPFRTDVPVIPTAGLRRRTAADARAWTDNGFSSAAAMAAAHAVVLSAVRQASPRGHGAVLDLGCGNGALLARIADDLGVRGIGIEQDASRVPAVAPHPSVHLSAADFFEAGWPAHVGAILLMPGRLLEVGLDRAAALRARLAARTDTLIAYAYGDWSRRSGSFGALLRESALDQDWIIGATIEGDGAIAAVLRRRP